MVAGGRVTGQAVAAVLTRFGATPTVCDDDPVMLRPHAERGLPTVSSSDAVQQITGYALVVASPGFSPATPLLAAAAAAGVPIWGDVELAWRLDAAGCYGPPRSWLVVTGTNGKTTTTSMLHAMLIAGGRRAVLCGNIGSAVLDVLDEPAAGELGVRDAHLVDRAFSDDLTLLPVASIPVPGPVGVLDALAAAALARSVGVPAGAIADAVTSFRVGRHRAEVVAVADGITYVDDSKATNPHAARASVLAYPRVVWIAGGLLKGASLHAEVAAMASRLVGAVLIGRDRAAVAEALSRHAPDVPVVQVVAGEDTGMPATVEVPVACVLDVAKDDKAGETVGAAVMTAAVAAARRMAQPGDTVLLAPAGASFDQFTGYADRGEAFATAVRAVIR